MLTTSNIECERTLNNLFAAVDSDRRGITLRISSVIKWYDYTKWNLQMISCQRSCFADLNHPSCIDLSSPVQQVYHRTVLPYCTWEWSYMLMQRILNPLRSSCPSYKSCPIFKHCIAGSWALRTNICCTYCTIKGPFLLRPTWFIFQTM